MQHQSIASTSMPSETTNKSTRNLTKHTRKHKKLLEFQLTRKTSMKHPKAAPQQLPNTPTAPHRRTSLCLLLSSCHHGGDKQQTAHTMHLDTPQLSTARCSTSLAHTAHVLDCSQMLWTNCPAWVPQHGLHCLAATPRSRAICQRCSNSWNSCSTSFCSAPHLLPWPPRNWLHTIVWCHDVFHPLRNRKIHGLVPNSLTMLSSGVTLTTPEHWKMLMCVHTSAGW